MTIFKLNINEDRWIWFYFIKLIMSTAERKAVIKHADMNEEMQQDAIDCANVALEKFNIEKDIAAYIKKEFDKKYNPTWHCVVGRNFGSYVTHETKHFIYFYMGQVAVLLFKSGWNLITPSPLTLPLLLLNSPFTPFPPQHHLFSIKYGDTHHWITHSAFFFFYFSIEV